MTVTRYCSSTDLLIAADMLGVSDTVRDKHTNLAADEIDSWLGFQRTVPILQNTVSPAGWLLLKRINIYIASGRLGLELDQGGEDDRLHAYYASLLEEGKQALKAVSDGDINIDPQPDGDPLPTRRGMLVASLDTFSPTEAFYTYTNPNRGRVV